MSGYRWSETRCHANTAAAQARHSPRRPQVSTSFGRRLTLGLRSLAVLAGVVGTAMPSQAAPPTQIDLLPARFTLDGPQARQALLVEERCGDEWTADLTGKARFSSSNPRVVVVDRDGTARAVGPGRAVLTASAGRRSARAAVEVRPASGAVRWSFRNHVLPVLTRTGCNSGACHGAAAGKGGLKLTLRGFDAAADYAVLTRQALGRRISLAEPEASLMLRKPAMAIPHGGGIRIKPGSLEYAVLRDWIAAGAPPPAESDARLERLEVLPARVSLSPGARQRVRVTAVFNDGRREDVTRWVKFGTSDSSVAAVSEDGVVTVQAPGEAAVTVWYLSRVAFATVTAPFRRDPGPTSRVPPAWLAQETPRGVIDAGVQKKLVALGIPPSGPCSDADFIRRAFLDAAGILPTPAEVKAFVAECDAERKGSGSPTSVGTRVQGSDGTGRSGSSSSSKNPGHPSSEPSTINPQPSTSRERLIDRLLQRPEFVDYWAYRWSDLLLVSSKKLPTTATRAFYNWIRASVAENKPWDRFARELLTASGSNMENGATNYFVLHKSPVELTETTTQAFLGTSLMCARCHNHPLEKWTQNDYYGMANLFARVSMKNGDRKGETLVFPADSGEVDHPRLGVPMPPRPLDGEPLPLAATTDRRQHLAAWLTAPENPYFARALVNRVWRNFMGRGLVEREDDLRLTNPPSNEPLLAALTEDFTRGGFDVRRLIRQLLASATYQRSATPVKENAADRKYYSHYLVRRLPAEVLLDALSQATGVPTDFPGYPKGTRALQLPDSQVASYFLTAFGRPERVQTCSCERQEEPNVAQALHLSNGETVNQKVRAPGGTLDRLLEPAVADEQVLDDLFLTALGRPPTAAERERLLPELRSAPAADRKARREVLEDLLWSLLTSKEFLFNH